MAPILKMATILKGSKCEKSNIKNKTNNIWGQICREEDAISKQLWHFRNLQIIWKNASILAAILKLGELWLNGKIHRLSK